MFTDRFPLLQFHIDPKDTRIPNIYMSVQMQRTTQLYFSPDSWQTIGVLTSQRWGLRWRTFEPAASQGAVRGAVQTAVAKFGKGAVRGTVQGTGSSSQW